MEEPYQSFEQNLKYLESVCEIQNHKFYVIVTYHPYSFTLYKCKDLLISTREPYNGLNILLNIMKLFHMKSIIELERTAVRWIIYDQSDEYNIPVPFFYKMDLAFTTNKFYCMTFALALTRTAEQVKKFISDAVEKYKLLKQTNCLPIELSVEISSYLIEFILMCMM